MSLEAGLAGIDSAEAIAMANAMNFDGRRLKTSEEMAENLGNIKELKEQFPGVFALAKHLINTNNALTAHTDPSPMAASERRGFESGVNAVLSTLVGLGLVEGLHTPELPEQTDQSTIV